MGNFMISLLNIRLLWLAVSLLATIQSCGTTITSQAANTALLLSGERVFGEEVQVSPTDLDDILALDDEMRSWVANAVEGLPYNGAKLRQLIQSMIEAGLLELEYDSTISNSAITTFHDRQGNCLSFSNLFVALAREAGLEATFQMVEIPPSFSSDGDLVLLNNHINVVVTGIHEGPNFMRRQVVDFNTAEYNGNYDSRRVSDNYVLALFHSNLAVEAIGDSDYRSAFEHLKQGINLEPGMPELWVNLGVFYSRHEHFDLAIDAYNHALAIRSSHKSAMTNLASVYQHIGEEELAERYRQRVNYYQERNPYYHYFLARNAFDAGDFDLALSKLRRSLRMKADEHQFYYLQGLSYLNLNDRQAAQRSFDQAREVAQRQDLIRAYEAKLNRLQLADQL